jgi:hypothetical protein
LLHLQRWRKGRKVASIGKVASIRKVASIGKVRELEK